MLESQPSGQPAASDNHGRFLWPQRILATILATMFAIRMLVLLLTKRGDCPRVLVMSRLPSSKTAKIWLERIGQCERSNLPFAVLPADRLLVDVLLSVKSQTRG